MFKFSNLFKHSENYKPGIQEIHHHVDMSSEKALAEAMAILESNTSKAVEKGERLIRFGFHSTKESIEYREYHESIKAAKKRKELIRLYSEKFPTHKFILEDQANIVLEKYNLYIGGVDLFNGFVPQRNLQEIEKFVSYYDLNEYFVSSNGAYSNWLPITKDEYEKGVRTNPDRYCTYSNTLYIMAPENQFTYRPGQARKQGRHIIDDPIVLHWVDGGYIIITAWGDEASDPIIVNEKNN